MDIAKSLFNQRDRMGYVGRDDHKRTIENASFDNDGDLFCEPLDEAYAPTPGGPFSALTPTMWPRDLLTEEPKSEQSENGSRIQYDEFGFHLDEKYSKDSSNKLFKEPFIEDSQHKLQWMAHLDFCEKGEVNDSERYSFSKTPEIQKLVYSGIPHSLRPNLWMQMSGADKKKKEEELSYQEIIQESSDDTLSEILLIERDLLRIMPGNACFMHLHSPGVPRLRRLLRCLAWLYPEVGYCHGLATIAASLLLFCEEEDAFWIVCAIVEDLLPASYYSSSFLGVQTDQRVLTSLFSSFMPELNISLHKHDLELPLITQNWFLTLFASVVHMRVLLRIWDCLFFEGSTILFQITLGMLKLNEISLQQLQNSAEIFNSLSDIPSQLDDIDELLKISFEVASSLSSSVIEVHRRRHLAYLVADQGLVINPKTHLTKRQIKKSRSMIQMLLFGEESGDIKSKNVKQTEILVDLREAIMQVARHFMAVEPKLCSNLVLVADYRMESHSTDHENYINVSRNRKRRAKALLDFERHDDDELGFRKNDIITVISQKDEHCWVGELNGLRGWFPAKFVQPLDERSKQYSSAGDDSVWETVTDLVRGFLGPAFKRVLEHGMRRPSFLGGPCHPWLFIEEAASREVERDFDSVYSRLVLCKTYRLDEDGKVLTPEELLYRCVQAINLTHDAAHAQMDVKLRSLVCLGLNEQALHLWLEVLCSSTQVVNKWYNPWSFMCSPGWVQVKCELRILSQFAFNLNPEWELPAKKDVQTQPLKDGVRDMLVKHHLFSWDL